MAIAEIEVAEGLLICTDNLALVYAAVGVVFRRAGRKGDSESRVAISISASKFSLENTTIKNINAIKT